MAASFHPWDLGHSMGGKIGTARGPGSAAVLWWMHAAVSAIKLPFKAEALRAYLTSAKKGGKSKQTQTLRQASGQEVSLAAK